MKTVTISPQSAELSALLDQAKEDDLLVQAPDGSEFVLSAVDDFAYEIARTRQNAKLMAFLDERAKRAKESPGIPLEEVERQLGL
jgi:hypothetical protein